MTEDIYWKMNEDDEHLQEEPSSRHLLVALEDLLKRSHPTSTFISKNKYQSKSVDDLLLYRREKTSTNIVDQSISTTTRTEFDLSGIGYDDQDSEDYSQIQCSRSAPISPTKIYEKELAAFIDCDQQSLQDLVADHFVYNIDLSDSNNISFQEDDFLAEEINYEPSVSLIHSSLINNCLTITEENEEELEQLRRDEEQQQKNETLLLEPNQNSTPIILLNDEDSNQIENELEDMHNHFDKRENNLERLSTIYETPSPHPELDDKLIIYDLANQNPEYHSSIIDRSHLGPSLMDTLFEPCPNLTNTLAASRLCEPKTIRTNSNQNVSSSPVINSCSSPILFPIDHTKKFVLLQKPAQHVRTMKVIQSTSSSLSDFISSTPTSTFHDITNYEDLPNVVHQSLINCSTDPILDNIERRRILTNGLLLSHCASNPTPRRIHHSTKNKSEEKLLFNSSSSSSSENLSSSDEKLLSRSEFLLQHEQNISPQRKASSLKSVFMTSPQSSGKILYPIDFEINHHPDISWHQKRSSQFPTSDSGIVIDTRPTPKSSIEEINSSLSDDNHVTDQLKQYQTNYRKTLSDLRLIKQHIVDIESRLNEAMRELEIEQALIEGEHELVFRQILEASESDQEKIRQLYKALQVLVERIMTEKNSLRNEIDYTGQMLRKHEQELYQLGQYYRSSDEKILSKKEVLLATRKRYEDLEFRLMELETRCESELDQAEEHFQTEQKLVTQNAKIRQNTLHDLDHQQYLVLYQATMEKEQLERDKQNLKLIFKQKKLLADELEQKIQRQSFSSCIHGTHQTIYQSTPDSSSQITNKDDQLEKLNEMMAKVILRENKRAQERPLTRYLPIRSADFDLRAHIEGAGHRLDSPHISLTSTICRGYLQKMGGMKFKTWNRRWFVFDRQRHSLFYYQDKTETKLRGCISFQSILEVYVDHLQSISLRSPEPREATFIVKTIGRSFYFVAPTVELMRIWVDVMITGAEGNTFAGN